MTRYKVVQYLIASVWLINGLFCKILNLVPRHQAIVERILGGQHGRALTVAIGVSEILMTIWILSGLLTRLNVGVQVIIIATMNIIEFLLVPDLLLWGRFNLLFAFLLILLILSNERHRMQQSKIR